MFHRRNSYVPVLTPKTAFLAIQPVLLVDFRCLSKIDANKFLSYKIKGQGVRMKRKKVVQLSLKKDSVCEVFSSVLIYLKKRNGNLVTLLSAG